MRTIIVLQKIYLDRTSIVAYNYEILQMSVIPPPLPFLGNQLINPFLISNILANHDKVEGFHKYLCKL